MDRPGLDGQPGRVLTREPASPPWMPEQLQSRPGNFLGLWYRPDWRSLLGVSIYHAEDRSSVVADEVRGSGRRSPPTKAASRPTTLGPSLDARSLSSGE